MKKLLYPMILILCFIISALHADSAKTNASVEKMFSVMGIDRQLSGGFEAMLPVIEQLGLQFKLDKNAKEELKNIYRVWFEEDIDREAMKNGLIEIYTEAFNEKEINELIVFYQSPVGQKFLKKSPELMKLGAQVGLRESQSKQQKLIERLQPFLDKHTKKEQ